MHTITQKIINKNVKTLIQQILFYAIYMRDNYLPMIPHKGAIHILCNAERGEGGSAQAVSMHFSFI